jgi:hypothetical protein
LTGDPYYTDGLRVVIFLASEPVPIEQVDFHQMGEPAAGQTLAGRRVGELCAIIRIGQLLACSTRLNPATRITVVLKLPGPQPVTPGAVRNLCLESFSVLYSVARTGWVLIGNPGIMKDSRESPGAQGLVSASRGPELVWSSSRNAVE